MSDRVAILHDVFTFFSVLDKYLVTGWCVLIDDDLFAVNVNDVALLFGGQTNND